MTGTDAHQLILGAGDRFLYQAAVVLATVIGAALVRRDSRGWPLRPAQRHGILLVAGLGSLIGCAIPAIFAGGVIGEEPLEWVGPKTILGGLLGGFLATAAHKRLTGNAADTSDGFARGAVVMMLIGRFGCIAQHCCYGRVTDQSWGIDLGDGVLRVPVQGMEALGLLVLAAWIQLCHHREWLAGRCLFALFASYGAMRFGLEFLRAQVADPRLGLGFYQLLALVLMAVGVHQLWRRSPTVRSPSVESPSVESAPRGSDPASRPLLEKVSP